jgi:ubiquinone biosynthesis protein UbiJ
VSISLPSLLLPAVLDRLVLLLNHVLAAEPAAVSRLKRHAGRSIALEWQVEPGPWPVPPALSLRITRAGLLERTEVQPGTGDSPTASPSAPEPAADASPDLRLRVELPAPHRLAARWLSGQRPAVSVEGDALLAADLAWLGENLRWDLGADLARIVGAGPAHELMRLAGAVGDALRRMLGAVRPAAGSPAAPGPT